MLSWAVIVDNTDLYSIVCQVHCGNRLIFKLLIIRITLSGWLLCPFPRWIGFMDKTASCCFAVGVHGGCAAMVVIDFQSLIQDLVEIDVGQVVSFGVVSMTQLSHHGRCW